MSYSIHGLDPDAFAHLAGLSDAALAAQGAVRVVADAQPGFPCRVRLEDAAPGESMLLLNHVSNDAATPFRASHAIFVTEGASAAARYRDQVPPVFETRILSLRGFDRNGMMCSAALAQPGEADAVIRALLADPRVDHIDAHNAAPGCFAARIERG